MDRDTQREGECVSEREGVRALESERERETERERDRECNRVITCERSLSEHLKRHIIITISGCRHQAQSGDRSEEIIKLAHARTNFTVY